MNIRLGNFETTERHREIVNTILYSGRITEGPYTKQFEQKFAEYIGVKHAIACTNGTIGLMLVVQAVNILTEKKLKFLVPATTFPATLNAVLLTGNDSLLCDVGNDMLINADEEKIREKRIDGIIPVHLLGYPCDMDYLLELKKKYGLFILEDACESTGSTYKGKKLGSLGDAGVFSFYISHAVSCGELGCITTNNDMLADIIRKIKNHGRVGSNLEFRHDYIGYNAKTTEFMTGIALAELERVDQLINRRKQIAKRYAESINNPALFLGKYSDDCTYLGYPILASSKAYKEWIVEKLTSAGIETRGLFPCLARQNAYQMRYTQQELQEKLPNSVLIEDNGFYIPCHYSLKDEEVGYIIRTLSV